MNYWVVKSNPKVFDAKRFLATHPSDFDWAVGAGAKKGDIVFIGQSGGDAAILAEVELVTDPRQGTGDPDDLMWKNKEEASKPRWFANVRLITNRVNSPIDAHALRNAGLGRIADFLCRRGTSLKLGPHEFSSLHQMLSSCPVCGQNPCQGQFFLNRAKDMYINSCDQGVVECPQCGSTGQIKQDSPCPHCAQFPPPRGAVCPLCKNRTYISHGIEKCPLCKGSGAVSPTEAATYAAKHASRPSPTSAPTSAPEGIILTPMTDGPKEVHDVHQAMTTVAAGLLRDELMRSWSTIHAGTDWVETLLVDSAVMDAVAPPEIKQRKQLLFHVFMQELFKRYVKHAYDKSLGLEDQSIRHTYSWFDGEVRGILSNLWPEYGSEKDSVSDWARKAERKLKDELNLPPGTVREVADQVIEKFETVCLGVCKKQLEPGDLGVLSKHFPPDVLARVGHNRAVCLLDCQRIWLRGIRLYGASERRAPDAPRIAAGQLGVVVWVHEQSHTTRTSGAGPLEEAHAQLETYRILDDKRSSAFAGRPSYRDLMKRLAQRQPQEYRLTFL